MYAPKLTLDEIYGGEPLYTARASDLRCRWLLQDRLVRDALSGGLLTMAGSLATLCSRSVVAPLARELLGRAGLEARGTIHTFGDPDDYRRQLEALSRERPVVVHHRHAPEELPEDRYWIPRELLSRLNDKACLAEWVPAAQVAPRRVVLPAALPRVPASALPALVKVATPDSSAGGFGVALCRTPADLARAAATFAEAPAVVVETRLRFERSLCLHFAVDRAGAVTFLAAADQVEGDDGHHDGNWLLPTPPPKEAVETAAGVVAAAWRRGYHGLAGLDVLVLPDGSHRIVDLNFRVNSSTGPALLWDALRAGLGGPVARSKRLRFPEGLAAARPRLERWIDAQRLLPLAASDPEAGPWRGQPAWVHALVLGESRQDVVAWMRSVGLATGAATTGRSHGPA